MIDRAYMPSDYFTFHISAFHWHEKASAKYEILNKFTIAHTSLIISRDGCCVFKQFAVKWSFQQLGEMQGKYLKK